MAVSMPRLIKQTRLWAAFREYRRISTGLRFVNWFTHRVVHGTKDLHFSVHFTSRVTSAGRIVLGKNVWYQMAQSGGLYVQANNGVEIGEDTLIAPGVKIISASHSLTDHRAHMPAKPIRIGKRCWLASNAVILPGVQLGDEVVVAAGAVVTKSFKSRSIVAGVPARVVGELDADLAVTPLSGGQSIG